MSDEKRPVPTEPGWWWRDGSFEPFATKVYATGDALRYSVAGYGDVVTDDGRWLAPVLTPAEADALRERAERAEQERDRYREAVRCLRLFASKTAKRTGDEVIRDAATDILSDTTDEAIQGYPEPPEPDAALVAKANAALVADLDKERAARMEVATHYNEARDEVAELRAELAAERGEAEGALPGWRRAHHPYETDNGSLWVRDGRVFKHERFVDGAWLVVTADRIRVFDAAGMLASIRRDEPSHRAAMRAAEAEARRLGLLKDEQ